MRKIQKNARIVSVNETRWSYTNGDTSYKICITFQYLSPETTYDPSVNKDAQLFLERVRPNNKSLTEFSTIVEIKQPSDIPLGGLLQYAKDKLLDKVVRMTTYIASVEELVTNTEFSGKFSAVYSGGNEESYLFVNLHYVGNYDFEQNVFYAMKNRLLNLLRSKRLLPKNLSRAELRDPDKSLNLYILNNSVILWNNNPYSI